MFTSHLETMSPLYSLSSRENRHVYFYPPVIGQAVLYNDMVFETWPKSLTLQYAAIWVGLLSPKHHNLNLVCAAYIYYIWVTESVFLNDQYQLIFKNKKKFSSRHDKKEKPLCQPLCCISELEISENSDSDGISHKELVLTTTVAKSPSLTLIQ